jgi:hypothetical protein
MTVNPIAAADALLDAVKNGDSEMTLRANIADWSTTQVREFIDHIIAEYPHHDLRLRGIRMPSSWFESLGARGDPVRGGKYSDVPVAVPGVDFNTLELVFRA